MGDDPVTPVYLCLEVAGCPTVCRHCWAQGTGYGMMPFADIEWVLARAHEYYDGRGLGFDSYPMHELAAYPDAAKLFSLFNLHGGTAAGGTSFEPWRPPGYGGPWPATGPRAWPRAGRARPVCRPDFDVYSGLAGLYRTRHGDADGLGVHIGPESVRYLRLHRAGRAGRGGSFVSFGRYSNQS